MSIIMVFKIDRENVHVMAQLYFRETNFFCPVKNMRGCFVFFVSRDFTSPLVIVAHFMASKSDVGDPSAVHPRL